MLERYSVLSTQSTAKRKQATALSTLATDIAELLMRCTSALFSATTIDINGATVNLGTGETAEALQAVLDGKWGIAAIDRL
ncbi:MAG: hypothetical protein KME45_09830 [Stenomitos rutilans HA7619-LM2]|jgi:hypothetical protein|nr:hypothetical protein [Stenomitos rutilans HA7619-LM2]